MNRWAQILRFFDISSGCLQLLPLRKVNDYAHWVCQTHHQQRTFGAEQLSLDSAVGLGVQKFPKITDLFPALPLTGGSLGPFFSNSLFSCYESCIFS
jgi:hypothetical protein